MLSIFFFFLVCSRVPVNTTAVINSASSCELTASLSSITYRQNIPHVARLKNRCPGADSWRNTVSLERNIERFTQDILKKLHVEGVQYLIMFHSNRSGTSKYNERHSNIFYIACISNLEM